MMLKYLLFFLLAKVGVEGSNPFARSRFFLKFDQWFRCHLAPFTRTRCYGTAQVIRAILVPGCRKRPDASRATTRTTHELAKANGEGLVVLLPPRQTDRLHSHCVRFARMRTVLDQRFRPTGIAKPAASQAVRSRTGALALCSMMACPHRCLSTSHSLIRPGAAGTRHH